MNEQLRQIASRIRELREILEVTPEEIADKVGVPLAEYLRYENSEADIPVGVLYGVAGVLEVDPTVLLTGEAPRMNAYTLVRKNHGVKVERYQGYSFESLAFNYQGRDMDPMIVRLLPGADTPELVTHGGQEFNLVLEGKMIVTIENHEFTLSQGDSIYFNPMLPHGQRAAGVPAKFLTVINE